MSQKKRKNMFSSKSIQVAKENYKHLNHLVYLFGALKIHKHYTL